MTNKPTSPSDDLLTDALKRAGKDKSEIDAIKTVDNAQAAANDHRKLPGAIQEALLSRDLDLGLFARSQKSATMQPRVAEVLERCVALVEDYLGKNKVFTETGAFNPELEADLTKAGFYGLTIPVEYGGTGATMHELAQIMLRLGRIGDPVIPGTLSVKVLIGPVGATKHFGTEEQKQLFLSHMASALFQGAFAGTEPSAGCNITKIRTYGEIEGDELRIYGEKLFISRATYGAEVAVFLKINGEYKVVKVDLPTEDTPEFRLNRYNLHVLQPALENNGLIFNGLRVPVKNILPGNGLEAIFKDLDDGRWAVGTSASIMMSIILASCPQWVKKRMTFGVTLDKRQGIQYRMSMIAADIAGAELLSRWTADQIDLGRAGDLSAMIAKTWSTNEARDVITKLGIEVHGGRSFFKGHPVGDYVLNALVATVYEGPNPMLAQAGVNALVKALRGSGLEDLGRGFKAAGVNMFDLMPNTKKFLLGIPGIVGTLLKNAPGLFANRKQILNGARGFVPVLINSYRGEKKGKVVGGKNLPDERFERHLKFAAKKWFAWRKHLLSLTFKYGEKLADEQLITEFEVYQPLADIVTMFVAIQGAKAAAAEGDTGSVAALNMLCEALTCRLSGKAPTSKGIREASKETMEQIMNGKIRALHGVPVKAIFQDYNLKD
jgi:alkylation response protein AidB-like acyl-CoA dehydrogenase